MASEDPADGAFSLAYALDAFHRRPFEYTGKVPYAFQFLEHNGYARHTLAVRDLYDNALLNEWGDLQLTSHRRLTQLAEKRLLERERRPLSLTIFPGDPARSTVLIERIAEYARVDTVVIITGLSGPLGRTALVSCAPIHWKNSRTNHTQVFPLLLKMMGVSETDWHTPIAAPTIVSSSEFPFARPDLTIYNQDKAEIITLCAPGYLCFVPDEPDIMKRITRFLSYQ